MSDVDDGRDLRTRILGSRETYLPMADDEREGDDWWTVGAIEQGAKWREDLLAGYTKVRTRSIL